MIRISGKRSLAQLNPFDVVVSFTLGSVMAYMMLEQVSSAEGAIVLALIIVLQLCFAKLAQRSKTFEKIFNAKQTLLFYKLNFLYDAMRKEPVTQQEIMAVIRQPDFSDLSKIFSVIMEPNGDLSVTEIPESNVVISSPSESRPHTLSDHVYCF